MKNRKKQRRARSHGTWWMALAVVSILCIVAFGGLRSAGALVASWTEDLPDVSNSEAFNLSQKTRVYANDESTLLAEFYIENREPVTLDQVSPYVIRGTIDTEDVRYYEHNGADPQGIVRALLNNVMGGALEGASTITQQFIRYTLLSQEASEISAKRKVREIELAIQLEKVYSKDEILLMYLNTINYGDGCYGIEAAAKNYFQKNAIDLELHEAATLAGIPQSPTYLNPKEYPEACLDRRNLVLLRMLDAEDITKDQYDAAVTEPLGLNPSPRAPSDGIYAYPYFTSHIRSLLLEEYTEAEVYQGGLTVYTTLDPELQNIAENAAAGQYAVMAEDLDVSLTAINPKTGYVVAMVGGKDYYADQFNLATQSSRQAGSSFKTFTLATAIEQGIDPKTKIDCTSPLMLGTWKIENYGGANYGIRSIESATAVSSNTGYANLVQEVKAASTAEIARRMGITSNLTDEDGTVPDSITLGSKGVNTLEMASAYATLSTGGIQRDPVVITKVVDKNHVTLFEHQDAPKEALSKEVAYATTQVLQKVFTEGTATAAQLPNGQEAAGKTGTSENWRDSWLCGYTPQLSCSVWIGARQERTMPESIDCSNVWRNFMSAALADQGTVSFKETFGDVKAPLYNNPFNKQQAEKYSDKKKADNTNRNSRNEESDDDSNDESPDTEEVPTATEQ